MPQYISCALQWHYTVLNVAIQTRLLHNKVHKTDSYHHHVHDVWMLDDPEVWPTCRATIVTVNLANHTLNAALQLLLDCSSYHETIQAQLVVLVKDTQHQD